MRRWRRWSLLVGFAALIPLVGATQGADSLSVDIDVWTIPATVYKVTDDGRAGTEGWTFNLVVNSPFDAAELSPVAAVFELYSADTLRSTTELGPTVLAGMKRQSYTVTDATSPLSPRRVYAVDQAFDLRLSFPGTPISWAVDRVEVSLTVATEEGERETQSLSVPVTLFEQQTELTFPLPGRGIVTQGTVNNWGHAGHANQFAIDVMGLNETYGPMSGLGGGLERFAGWGRDVVAPAGGRVVYARNDVPDTPPGTDPAETYGVLNDPIRAIAGNCVVIDHGNGEYSTLMHMREGSIRVAVGETVVRGQVVGAMGNSGDSFGVHLHYQLQDGPELHGASSLPATFQNLDGVRLDRGVFFEASRER